MRREVISTTTVAGAILLALTLLAALLLGARAQPAEAQTASGNQFAPDSIIVKLKTGAASGALQSTNDRIGARAEKKIAPNLEPRLREIKLPAGLSVGAALARYRGLPNVQYAEPNYLRFADLTPTDTSYADGSLWGLNNTGQNAGTNDADIDAPEAWDTATGNSGPVVAVIDSGVNYNHPDLTGNNWTNTAEANGVAGTDDDANGYIDDVRGWDYVNNDADPNDDNSHGTHVAGTIGAKANNGGVVGVNHQVRIMPLKFLSSSGSGSTANAIRAVDYASANGATISNNSWGGGGFSQGLLDAINRANTAGQLFVAAAGNSGVNNDTTPHYPSSYNAPNIISVAATDRNDRMASFSNYGATSVDLAAPGSSILSTVLGSNYGTKSGTSMATPHVAGVAALLKSEESALTPAQIKDLLLQNVDTQATHPNLSGVSGKMVSGGRLNAAKALAKLTPPPPDTTAPSVSGVTPTDPSGVATNAPVTATFDEPMDKASLNTAFTLTKQGTTENVGTSVTYDAANNKATLNHPDLEADVTYIATVKGGADGAKDAAGNALAADKVWSFTTAPPDTTAPTVSSFTPTPDRVTGVDRGTNVTAKFSEAMNPVTANTTTFMLFKGTTSAPPSSYTTPIASGTTVTLSTDGLTATLNPYGSSSKNLARGTWYTAVVKGGAADCTSCAKDKAGNPLAADKVWSFKTKS